MDLETVMARLEAVGTEQNRKIYRRHGVGENQFGVSVANLKALKKEVKTDQALAEGLWQTGNADAQNLAFMIADPKLMTAADLDRWLNDLDNYFTVDMFTQHLASRSPHARDRAEAWSISERDYFGQAGWNLFSHIATTDRELADAYFEGLLELIVREIHQRPNRTRYSMNTALIAIGTRNEHLRELATATARRIGPVEVDHGETGCVTPDAVPYIDKTWARKQK